MYRLADYLDQHGRQHRKGQIPPPEFWAAAAAYALPTDQASLGNAARDRGLYRDAAQLHKNAAAAGNHSAVTYLAGPRFPYAGTIHGRRPAGSLPSAELTQARGLGEPPAAPGPARG